MKKAILSCQIHKIDFECKVRAAGSGPLRVSLETKTTRIPTRTPATPLSRSWSTIASRVSFGRHEEKQAKSGLGDVCEACAVGKSLLPQKQWRMNRIMGSPLPRSLRNTLASIIRGVISRIKSHARMDTGLKKKTSILLLAMSIRAISQTPPLITRSLPRCPTFKHIHSTPSRRPTV